jgi:antitoxin component of MazEF toxin-antitoxin module
MDWQKVTLNQKVYHSIVEEVDGELVLNLPDDLLQSLGWGEGTLVEWSIDNESASITIAKVNPDYTEL